MEVMLNAKDGKTYCGSCGKELSKLPGGYLNCGNEECSEFGCGGEGKLKESQHFVVAVFLFVEKWNGMNSVKEVFDNDSCVAWSNAVVSRGRIRLQNDEFIDLENYDKEAAELIRKVWEDLPVRSSLKCPECGIECAVEENVPFVCKNCGLGITSLINGVDDKAPFEVDWRIEE